MGKTTLISFLKTEKNTVLKDFQMELHGLCQYSRLSDSPVGRFFFDLNPFLCTRFISFDSVLFSLEMSSCGDEAVL